MKRISIFITTIALVLGGVFVSTGIVFAVDPIEGPTVYVTTNPATVTATDVTLNGTNGDADATEHSFWVSTSTFSIASSDIPENVYSTPVFAGVSAGSNFSSPLSIVTTDGITFGQVSGNMSAITPDTTYHFVAWSKVDGTWYPGEIQTFTTATATVIPPVSPALVNLGTAGNYAILSKTSITTTGTTHVVGNIGVSPLAASTITGFSLVLPAASPFSTSALVTGRIYASDYANPTPANLTTAVSNMETAYTDAKGRPAGVGTFLNPGPSDCAATCDLGGLTLVPGVYTFTGDSVTITGDLYLAGSASDVWIFQIPGTLDISGAKEVLLSDGAVASNVFWAVSGTTTLEPGSTFEGNILAGPGASTIAMQDGAILHGRALGQKEVTMIGNTVTSPNELTTPFITVTSPNGGETLYNQSGQPLTWTSANVPTDRTLTLTLRTMGTGDINLDGKVSYADFTLLSDYLTHGAVITDLNNDGKIDFDDYLAFEQNFGKSSAISTPAADEDINGDGKVNFADYLILEQNFGKSSDILITDHASNTGTYDADLSSMPLGRAKIIATVNGTSVNDQSDNYFTIVSSDSNTGSGGDEADSTPTSTPTIAVSSPNGGGTWNKQDPQTVTWTGSGLSSSDILTIVVRTAAKGDINGDGKVSYADFTMLNDYLTIGDVVTDLNDSGTIDSADRIIFEQNFGKVTKNITLNPAILTAMDINGDGAVNFADYLVLEQNFGKFNDIILSTTTPATDGTFIATPELLANVPVGQAKIVVTVNGMDVSDQSDNYFTIVSSVPAVTEVPAILPVSRVSSRGGGGGGSCAYGFNFQLGKCNPTALIGASTSTVSTTGLVLGASTFQFTSYLRLGMSGDAVKQLQERLRAEKFFTYPTSTGYFGPITLFAVKLYQATHGIPATGFVGPLTIAELNK